MTKQALDHPKWQRRIAIALVVLISLTLIIVTGLFIYANIKLGGPTQQRVNRQDQGISYTITQDPKAPVVGQEVVFIVAVQYNMQSLPNAKFKVQLTKQGKISPVMTGLQLVQEQEVTTNANGTLSFSYTPNFEYPLPDLNVFSIWATPETSTQLAESGYDPNTLSSSKVDFTVYPRWLGWFKFK